MYFTLAANVGSMFLASGAAVKCMLLYCVNVLEGVFEIRSIAEKHGGLNALTNAHIQYVHTHVHT